MSFNFEVFDRRSGRLTRVPEITVQAAGTLSLNAAAAHLLGNAAAVELLYDRERRVVGIRPVDPEAPHAYPLRPVGDRSTYIINARAFFLFYDLPLGEAVRRDVRLHEGVVILDLNEPGRVTSVRRKRSGVNGSASPEASQASGKLAEESSR